MEAGGVPAVAEVAQSYYSVGGTAECQTCTFLACYAEGRGFGLCKGKYHALDLL